MIKLGIYSEQKNFRKNLESAFPLAKRAAGEAGQLDVKIFLKFLKKHKLFGESLKQEIAEIYDLLHESWELAEEIRNKPEHEKEFDRLNKITYELETKNTDLLNKLDAGKHMILQMGKNLRMFYNDELKILSLLKEFNEGLHREGKLKQVPHATQLVNEATNIQGALHQIKPLFEAIATAYEKDSIEIGKMIEEEMRKVEYKVRGNDAQHIDFRKILEHVKYVEGQIDKLIEKAEKEQKLANVSQRSARMMEILIGKMLEREEQQRERFRA
ncbi:hypothetical protein JW898_05830 [Candidatus Woesearchaeota archaeon]|nr:hypothetical protein [Candidatus Woesearchaeota archaeon]